MKNTYRKGFNFFRSYFDVCNELPDKERLQFLDALLNKQFLGQDPDDLTGQARFAWISQMHSIDSQVKGYETKTGSTLSDPTAPPTVAPCLAPPAPPTLQVQVEVQEKGKGKEVLHTTAKAIDYDLLLQYINKSFGRKFLIINLTIKTKYKARLKEGYTNLSIRTAIDNCKEDKYHRETNYKYCTPEFFSRSVTLDKYSGMTKKTNTIIVNINSAQDVKNLYQ